MTGSACGASSPRQGALHTAALLLTRSSLAAGGTPACPGSALRLHREPLRPPRTGLSGCPSLSGVRELVSTPGASFPVRAIHTQPSLSFCDGGTVPGHVRGPGLVSPLEVAPVLSVTSQLPPHWQPSSPVWQTEPRTRSRAVQILTSGRHRRTPEERQSTPACFHTRECLRGQLPRRPQNSLRDSRSLFCGSCRLGPVKTISTLRCPLRRLRLRESTGLPSPSAPAPSSGPVITRFLAFFCDGAVQARAVPRASCASLCSSLPSQAGFVAFKKNVFLY